MKKKDNWDKLNVISSSVIALATIGLLVLGWYQLPKIEESIRESGQIIQESKTRECLNNFGIVAGRIYFVNKTISPDNTIITSINVSIRNPESREDSFLVNVGGEYIFTMTNSPWISTQIGDKIDIMACLNLANNYSSVCKTRNFIWCSGGDDLIDFRFFESDIITKPT